MRIIYMIYFIVIIVDKTLNNYLVFEEKKIKLYLPTIRRLNSNFWIISIIKKEKKNCYNLHTLHWTIASLWNAPKMLQCKQTKEYARASANQPTSHSPDSFAMWKIMRTYKYIAGSQIDAKYSLYSFSFFFSLVLVNLISFGRLRFVNMINYNSQPNSCAQISWLLLSLLVGARAVMIFVT